MKNIELINASAGSGKTYSLAERIVQILQEGMAPEALMATTFTNKAADELRRRIRQQLLKKGMPDEARRIMDGLVGTVNGVCARLLSEYAVEAGLSPALDVLPESDASTLFRAAVSAVIGERAGLIEPAARRLSLDGSGSGYAKNRDWRDDVRRTVELARANRIGPDRLAECARLSCRALMDLLGPPGPQDLDARLGQAVRQAISRLETVAEPKKGTQDSLDKLRKFERDLQRGGAIPWSSWVRLSKLKTNKDAAGVLDQVNRIAASILGHPRLHADLKEVIEGVFACAGEALEAYETFKRRQGLMDFVDQEAKVLDLAAGNKSFRDSMRDRLGRLMVDEFQDTSPIQLALFMELNGLAGSSTWVGDPKQAIYGFRDTDPELMEAAARKIGTSRVLGESWRSRKVLVEFCNAVFSLAFHDLGKEKVCLKIPEERSVEAAGGWLESWNLDAGNIENETQAIAAGVKDLLERRPEIRAGSIAVLCRTNDKCRSVASKLETLGIRASASRGALLDTTECRLAMAALRYMHDGHDTLALTEIVCLSPLHGRHEEWLAELMCEKDAALGRWRASPLIQSLDRARANLRHWTPLEALEQAIGRVRLERTMKSWPDAALRRGNLDRLRGACIEYQDQCRARRTGAGVAGFISFLRSIPEEKLGQAQGFGADTIQVLTYHGAKGLEWPVVVLTGLDGDSAAKADAFGVHVTAAPIFDPARPLEGRSIRFWPWPFGSQETFTDLDGRLSSRPEEVDAKEKARGEARRLLYVGMTRARDGMVLAVRRKQTKAETTLKTAWLDELTDAAGKHVLELPKKAGNTEIAVGPSRLPLLVMEYSPASAPPADGVRGDVGFLFAEPGEVGVRLPAKYLPSDKRLTDGTPAGVFARIFADLGGAIAVRGKPDANSLGSAVHGFLAVDLPGLDGSRRRELAERIRDRWEVVGAIETEDLLLIGDRLKKFLGERFPGATVRRECPVTFRNAEFQYMNGYIDMLVESPGETVLLDHKSYAGNDPEKHALTHFPQLAAYRVAVGKATGRPLPIALLHMPMAGKIYELSISNG